MINWLLIAFTAGIFFSGYLNSNIPVFLVALILFYALFLMRLKKIKIKFRLISLILFSGLLFLGSMYFNCSYNKLFEKTENTFKTFKTSKASKNDICGTVSDNITTYSSGSRFIIKTEDNVKFSVSYKGVEEIFPGDKVLIKNPSVTLIKKEAVLSSFNKNNIGNEVAAILECGSNSIEKTGVDNKFFIQRKFYEIRKNTFSILLRFLEYDEAAFVYSVVSSDKSYLSNELREKFVNSGIFHLCTVSGFHFAFLCMFLTVVTLIFTKRYRVRICISLVFATLFLMYTGFNIAVLRAYIMFFCAKICDLFYIDKMSSKRIFIIVLGAFIFESPLIIYNISFILSFSAIAGLLFFYPVISELINARDSKVKNYIATTLSVNIFMITAGYFLFGYITIWSFLSNALIEFIVGPLMVFILVICVAGIFISPVAYFLAPVLKLGINYVFMIVNVTNILPKVKISFPLSMMTAVFLIGFCWFFIKFLLLKKRKCKSLTSLLCAFLCIFMTVFFYFSQYIDDNTYISYIGDTVTIDILNKHKHYVIGSFEDIYYNSYDSMLKQNEVIEALLITDSDIDVSLFEDFIRTYKVKNVLINSELKDKIKEASGSLNISDDMKYKNSFISLNYNDNAEFIIKNNRFIVTDNIRYIAYDVKKENDCSIIFSDYDNIKYKTLIKKLKFPESVNMIIHSEGYENVTNTGRFSIITVSENGNIKIN